MKKVNIFNKEVSVFDSLYDTKEPVNCTLKEVLGNRKFQGEINKYRESKDDRDKKKIPAFMPSGIFKGRKNEDLIKHNNVVCIDIDKKDNLDVINFDEIPTLIRQIPYVAYCGHSCGGEGYFILLPIEDSGKHKEHYVSICDDFERCGITVDKSCKAVSKSRIFSYDDKSYYNNEAVVYTREKEDVTDKRKGIANTKENKIERRQYKSNFHKKYPELERIEFMQTKADVELVIQIIRQKKIDITRGSNGYDDWYKIGAALANQFGEDGREYFHQVSCYHPKYNKQETDKKFDSVSKLAEIGIGTFFDYAKKYDVYPY